MVHSVADAETLILKAARSGKCVLWSRNTVDDAIRAAKLLRDEHGTTDVTVYHARFPDAVRTRIQEKLLHRFGKGSRGEERAGGIVVSTQIMETSFDIDFDLPVVDLKPIDGVSQTAGRGCRHPRDPWGDPLVRDGAVVDARAPHEIVLVSPDPEQVHDADWYRDLLPAAAGVYRNPGELWRTARTLRTVGGIVYPTGVRPLIEAVFGNDEAPEPLQAASLAAEGDQAAERSLARPHIFDPNKGYEHTIAWGNDERIPTRLGNSIEIVLVKETRTGSVEPFEGEDWSSGCMRLSSKRVYGPVPHELSINIVDMIQAQARHAEIVRIVFDDEAGLWRGSLQRAEKPLCFTIHELYGLEWA